VTSDNFQPISALKSICAGVRPRPRRRSLQWSLRPGGERACYPIPKNPTSALFSLGLELQALHIPSPHVVSDTAVFVLKQQPFYGPLSGTTPVSRYQKKHSPTHRPDHHPIFISFFHLPRSITSSLFKLHAWQSFCTTSFHVFFGLPLGLEPTTSYSIHFFTQSVSSFRSTCHTIATCFAVVSTLYHQYLCWKGTLNSNQPTPTTFSCKVAPLCIEILVFPQSMGYNDHPWDMNN